jgi:polysaccharide pyruvyl transferase WcaK-like protein
MEQLDEALAEQVLRHMRHPESARKFSARLDDASQMTCLLRGLDLLVTSRYHAAVLSLAAGVPQVAMHHDTRLATLYEDLGLKEEWFMDPGPAEDLASVFTARKLFKWLQKRVDMLLANPRQQKDSVSQGYAEHLALAKQNRTLLGEFVAGRGLCPDLSDTDLNGGAEWVA